MNHSEQRFNETRHRHYETVVARHLRELFRRLPMLSGFWLHADLKVANVVFDWNDCTPGRDLYDQVTESIVQLAEECPEAVQLMRGRTFARVVH
jgi:Ser/Thr protein kinase RdoA (MazF antagonist)